MRAAKWSAIITQPVNQSPDTGVRPRRATDPNAQVKRATAPKSGNVFQLTRCISFAVLSDCSQIKFLSTNDNSAFLPQTWLESVS